MLKHNQIQENNKRDLRIVFLNSTIIYGLIGIFGGLGLYGIPINNPATILDYFAVDDYPTLLINFFYLIHLLSNFPMINYIGKYKLAKLLFPNVNIPNILFYGYSIFFAIICVIFQIVMLKPDIVIGFTGCVGGFLIIFIYPVAFHWKILYYE